VEWIKIREKSERRLLQIRHMNKSCDARYVG
jgi:hypothetical protein